MPETHLKPSTIFRPTQSSAAAPRIAPFGKCAVKSKIVFSQTSKTNQKLFNCWLHEQKRNRRKKNKGAKATRFENALKINQKFRKTKRKKHEIAK